MGKLLYIVDIFQSIVQKVSDEIEDNYGFKVHYIYGHPSEAVEIITELTKQGYAGNKYPLIYLYMDFDEEHDGTNLYCKLNLHFAIATWTQPGYKAYQRYNATFKTVLYPVYQEFIQQVANNAHFGCLTTNSIQHTKTDRPYWGSSNGKGNVANDYCDAIEITNLKLSVLNQFC